MSNNRWKAKLRAQNDGIPIKVVIRAQKSWRKVIPYINQVETFTASEGTTKLTRSDVALQTLFALRGLSSFDYLQTKVRKDPKSTERLEKYLIYCVKTQNKFPYGVIKNMNDGIENMNNENSLTKEQAFTLNAFYK